MNFKIIIDNYKNDPNFFRKLLAKKLSNFIFIDKLCVSLQYRIITGKKINLINPKGFNEKIQWLKLFDRKPEYSIYVDKYKAREYIATTIGEEYLIPLLGVWNNPDDIDFDKLPNQFVLKCNHDSGGLCICKDKNNFDIEAAKLKLRKTLNLDYYSRWREWAYKNINRKIIAEILLHDKNDEDLKDYKVMCFNGKAKFIRVYFNRNTASGLNINWYDLDWNFYDIRMVEPPNRAVRHEKPKCLKKMIELSEKLAKDLPFARIDWYVVNDKLYSGEITLYPDAGYADFEPKEYDEILGGYIKLPNKNDK